MIRLIVRAGVAISVFSSVLAAQNPAPPAPPTAPPPSAPVVVPTARTAAQDAAAKAGKVLSNSEIANAIKSSGLSETQVRARLQAGGFDAKLADPFFSVGGGAQPSGGTPAAPADPSFVNALQALGIINTEVADQDKKNADTDAEKRNVAELNAGGGGVFGKSIFSGSSSAFDPVSAGPVDPSYRLGVGDQLQYVVTGDMEMALGLEVRRDGSVILPQIGQVQVAGLTLDAARTLLSARAGRVYSLINSGKAHIDLAVSRVRTNQVYVIGEVERPGAFQVSALATVFRALVGAGGPTIRGTFRNIEVRRGNKVISHVDLYDYLLRGDASNDIRTEQGDIIFVGLSTRIVAIQGAVRRPGIFELRDGEGFAQLLQFAGGLQPTAVTDRLQIDRVLPPAERTPGRDRAVIDVPFSANFQILDTVRVFPNDVVSVFAIGNIRRNQVSLQGEVFQPGTFEWTEGMTMTDLLKKGQGFLPWALTDRIKLERPIVNSGRTEIFSLNALDSGFARFPVREFDVVSVLDGRRAFPSGNVAIQGAVVSPGVRPYFENETLADLIDVADGTHPWALRHELKLTRVELGTGKRREYSLDLDDPAAGKFRLRPGDAVLVLDARLAELPSLVTVTGAVIRPGQLGYIEHQTLRDVIAISGGFRPEATLLELARRHVGNGYTDTSSVVRTFAILPNGHLEGGGDSIVVARGDAVSIRDNPGMRPTLQTVSLAGLFTYPGVYALQRDGERLADVVRRAGGVLPSAYLGSGQLVRQGRPVAVDVRKALRGDEVHNLTMRSGDQLSVSYDPSVVYVAGSVERQVVVPFRSGWGIDQYIDAAGGFATDADQGDIVVEYPSGELHRRTSHLFLPTKRVTVVSGSTITVARKPEEKPNNLGELFTRTLQVATTVVSVFLAYKAATR